MREKDYSRKKLDDLLRMFGRMQEEGTSITVWSSYGQSIPPQVEFTQQSTSIMDIRCYLN